MPDENKKKEELEKDLESVTDSKKDLDGLVKGTSVLVFRCAHSGLYFPSDYLRMWGRKYGIGLGRNPVSEILDTNYEAKLPDINDVKDVADILFPFGVCRSQVDSIVMKVEEARVKKPIIAVMDTDYYERREVIRKKQLKKDKRLQAYLNSVVSIQEVRDAFYNARPEYSRP